MSTLSREEIARRLPSLQGWTLDGNAIKKQYTFRDFPEAVRFVDRLVPVAEAADHHPDISDQLQTRDAHVLDAQRRRPHGEGLRGSERSRPSGVDATEAHLQLARGGGAHRPQRAPAADLDAAACCRRRFHRTRPPRAATPNGATRPSSCSSCSSSAISVGEGSRSPSSTRSSNVLSPAISHAALRGHWWWRRRAVADRRRRHLRAHGGGEFYNLLEAPTQPLLVIGNEGLLKELSGKVRAKRKKRAASE